MLPYGMTRFQEDKNMSAKGIIFLMMPAFEDMNPRKIVSQAWAFREYFCISLVVGHGMTRAFGSASYYPINSNNAVARGKL